ncbi:MAG: virulence factor, partial [Betaproteobacteria bacterium]|nr:virulence factor [Betaproteobacteria bacterium]
MYSDRIRLSSLQSKVMSAEEAATLIRDGMTVGMSGFTRAGEAKAVPLALIERAKQEQLKISLVTGASLGNDLDGKMASAGLLARRMPFQADPVLRKAINNGEVMFIDQHLSHTVEQMRNHQIKRPDVAIIEAGPEIAGKNPETTKRLRAAMKAGLAGTDAYLSEWRRADPVEIAGDDEAVAEAEAARIETAQARLTLATSIASAYADLARLYADRDVLSAALDLRIATQKLVANRVATGLDTRAELKQADAAVPAARADLVAIDDMISATRHELAALL